MRTYRLAKIGVLSCLVFLSSAWGQVSTATFYGIATDSTRAVVPGAAVTMVNTQTGVTYRKVSDSAGEFAFDFLPTGTSSANQLRFGGNNPRREYRELVGNGAIRGPRQWNLDFSLAKNFAITERLRLKFGADMFNALNHTILSGLVAEITNPRFGQLTSTNGARLMQLNAHLNW